MVPRCGFEVVFPARVAGEGTGAMIRYLISQVEEGTEIKRALDHVTAPDEKQALEMAAQRWPGITVVAEENATATGASIRGAGSPVIPDGQAAALRERIGNGGGAAPDAADHVLGNQMVGGSADLPMAFAQLLHLVKVGLPDGREKSLAVTNLEQAEMWAKRAYFSTKK